MAAVQTRIVSAAIVALAIEGHIKIEEKDGVRSKRVRNIFKGIKDVCERDFGDD
jgi:hypothetical protein